MIALKLSALALLLTAFIWGNSRFIMMSAKEEMIGGAVLIGIVWIAITGACAGAIIETML